MKITLTGARLLTTPIDSIHFTRPSMLSIHPFISFLQSILLPWPPTVAKSIYTFTGMRITL